MTSIGLKISTAARLGVPNVTRFVWYKLQLKGRFGPASLAPPAVADGDIFGAPEVDDTRPPPAALLPLRYFGWLKSGVQLEQRPDWFLNPVTGRHFKSIEAPWHRLPDFDARFGDIKWVWELSRLDWAVRLAQHIRAGTDPDLLLTLNGWLRDWLQQNPAYCGPNWKCGQEASIRLLHLTFAARILNQAAAPSKPLMDLVLVHLRRIAASTHYAIAQDNNHGTSEGAALFIGGAWMARCGARGGSEGFAEKGRRLLENRVARLVMEDGSFSQYSVNYHRLMLDTLSLAELWRRDMGQPKFSDIFYRSGAAAARWLYSMVDAETGDAPNIGANDGARLLPLTDGYRDYRPSVQLACALFLDRRAYQAPTCDDQLRWLDLSQPSQPMPPTASATFGDGGFAVMRLDDAKVVARFPRFRFRPSHADALHVDLWYRGHNVLRDSGTYSYNTAPETMAYFTGVAGHNTVQFDGRDQMPRLSRFLYGRWLKTRRFEPVGERVVGTVTWSAAYRDWLGAEHRRRVVLSAPGCRVIDSIRGFKVNAVLRWHLGAGEWKLENGSLRGQGLRIEIECDGEIGRLQLVQREVSLYYGKMDPIAVLEVEVRSPSTIETVIAWPSKPNAVEI